MNDGQSLVSQMNELIDVLDNLLAEQYDAGIKLAVRENDYRHKQALKILEFTAQGKRATLIPDLVRGDAIVSPLRQERDIAKVLYDNKTRAIDATKLKMRILSDQINREWGRNTNG